MYPAYLPWWSNAWTGWAGWAGWGHDRSLRMVGQHHAKSGKVLYRWEVGIAAAGLIMRSGSMVVIVGYIVRLPEES